jgi:hypothetical protein
MYLSGESGCMYLWLKRLVEGKAGLNKNKNEGLMYLGIQI